METLSGAQFAEVFERACAAGRHARVRVLPYCLPLRRPWIAASATLAERRGALVCVTDADGLSGWGDCAPLPSSGAAAHAQVLAALSECGRRVGEAGFDATAAELPPEVRWAIQTALLDLEAQRSAMPLHRLLAADSVGSGQGAATIGVNAALGALDDGCTERAAQAIARGFAVGKIKVGVAGVEKELARLRALAAVAQGRLRLRLDANRAWPEAQARHFLEAIADLPIEAIEEPLAAPTLAALARVQDVLPFPIAVDESLRQLGVAALTESRAVRRLVVKPARLGDYAATFAVARDARSVGIELVLTSVVDSAVGVTAAAHLAAALAPAAVHGLGTGEWLASDVAVPLQISLGCVRLPAVPGLGVEPRSESIGAPC